MPAPTSGLRTHTACSQGVVKVVEDTWLLTGHVPREAGVVQVADETLEPGHSARGGQRLAGEVACGNARCYGPCQGPHRDPTQPCIGCWVCALWRLLTGAPVHRVTPLPPPLGKHLDPGGGLHSCCSNGGWEERTATRIKKRKRGHNSSTRSWIWGRQNKQGSAERRGALGLCPTCPRRPPFTGCLLRYRKFFQSSSISCVLKAMVEIDRRQDLGVRPKMCCAAAGNSLSLSELHFSIPLCRISGHLLRARQRVSTY